MALCAEELHVSEAPLMHNQLENIPEVPEGKQPTHEQVWMSRPLFQHHNEGWTCSGWGPPPWKLIAGWAELAPFRQGNPEANDPGYFSSCKNECAMNGSL